MADIPYPRRPAYFSTKFNRLLAKTCAAQEIGTVAAYLLTVIVGQEDSCRYRRAVTFYDGQLMPLIGVTSHNTLSTARKKAVNAGWLNYAPGSKCRPGRYWVTVPLNVEGIADDPIEEDSDREWLQDSGQNMTGIGTESDSHPECTSKNDANRESIENESRTNRESKVAPFVPKPIPNPEPKEKGVGSDSPSDCRKTEKTDDAPEVIPERLDTHGFREAWSAWHQHLQEKRKPAKPTTRRMQLKMLADMGTERAIAALEHSITQGWQGIFEPPTGKGSPPRKSSARMGEGTDREGLPF